MSDINEDLRGLIPFERLADQLGASPDEVAEATELALPALLSGINANARGSSEGAESLFGALIKDHSGSVLDADDLLSAVNPTDGEKIVGHVFGSQSDQVVNRIGAQTGQAGLIQKLLPMLAPLVMGWLSRKMGGAVAGSADSAGAPSGGGLGDILGGMLGGGDSGGSGGGGLGDLLGGVLGGGSSGSGGGLGGMLGGLLGGSKSSAAGGGAPDLGGMIDILGGLTGSAGQTSGAQQRMPDLSDLFGG